ncbi:type III-A CRISPR-associated protein Cas10/Csm1 [Desulfoluna butyratoxydans]|uniref:CRISPR system single-strand-specific deoxyribonuclease Cas10/Csm1 (subtype III-A) n=1 Tax=Desulfoluna butyratoxydans TaxID=231438 RepID=A0A4U8YND9_9BACT|nr:type III-A CRISPR-associated protein Cas10/Csm1 [Desulfoluna butyratoxydans]VFQ43172.1 crispr-associated protein csm1 [Desulfoluna butyratoxydans]
MGGMDNTTAKVTTAALFHDIGKVADWELLGQSLAWVREQKESFATTHGGRTLHTDALFSRTFLERQAKSFPTSLLEGDENLLSLVERGQNPVTALEWIVSEAASIAQASSPRKTADGDEATDIKARRSVRLAPILETLSPTAADDDSPHEPKAYRHHYKLAALCPEDMDPVTEKGDDGYEILLNELEDAFSRLPHRDHHGLWLQHVDSLLMRTLCFVPADQSGHGVADVPLYDQLRISAAMACALSRYHQDTGTLNPDAVKDRKTEKFLLVNGDFTGIQPFIFKDGGESRKFRSKLLRGRSFQVSLFIESVVCRLCEAMGISPLCAIMKAGGKFTLLAPNTQAARDAVAQVKGESAGWFLSMTHGESGMAISTVTARPVDFQAPNMVALWQRMHRTMALEKFQRLDMGAVCGRRARPVGRDNKPCPLCHVRPVESAYRESRCCAVCHDQIWLGENLVKHRGIRLTTGKGDLKEPVLGRYQLTMENDLAGYSAQGEDVALWQFGVPGKTDPQVAIRCVNGYVPVFTKADEEAAAAASEEGQEAVKAGDPKHFQAISDASRSSIDGGACVSALGVLKADVDYLGMLFACGLSDERYTLTRLTTLSRQLDMFFSVRLPWILEHHETFCEVYTVFAGGDDLFLIGPWRQILQLAPMLRDEFSRYVAGNPEVHFSCGITLEKAHTPVDDFAERAEHVLGLAKDLDDEKNRISVFGCTVSWPEMKALDAWKQEVVTWLEKKWLTTGMLYRVDTLVTMAEEEARLGEKKTVSMDEMACLKWRSQLAYMVARNVDKEAVGAVHGSLADALQTHGGNLRIPLWTLLYERRRRAS